MKSSYLKERTDRCLGILTKDELKILSKAVICGAGCGGVGGWAYLNLARLGCSNFKLADPEIFDAANANRQAGCVFETVGKNKAKVIAHEIKKINPDAKVEVWSNGITTPQEANNFMDGGSIVIDGIELYEFIAKKNLFDIAFKKRIPIISTPVFGYGAALAIFEPNKSPDFESYFGPIPEKSDEYSNSEYVKNFAMNLFGFKPKSLDMNFFLSRVAKKKIPSIISSCTLAGSLCTTAAIDYLTGKKNLPIVPITTHIDLMQHKIVRTGPIKRWILKKCMHLGIF